MTSHTDQGLLDKAWYRKATSQRANRSMEIELRVGPVTWSSCSVGATSYHASRECHAAGATCYGRVGAASLGPWSSAPWALRSFARKRHDLRQTVRAGGDHHESIEPQRDTGAGGEPGFHRVQQPARLGEARPTIGSAQFVLR